MKIFSILLLVLFFFQSFTNASDELNKYIEMLNSDKFNNRYSAVKYFIELGEKDYNASVSSTLFSLLEQESIKYKEMYKLVIKHGHVDKIPDNLKYLNSEDWGHFITNICRLLGKKSKKKYLALVMENCYRPRILINYGEAIIDPVLQKLKDKKGNPSIRVTSVHILNEFITSGDLLLDQKKEIIKVLTRISLEEEDKHVKRNVADALSNFDDKELKLILEGLEKENHNEIKSSEATIEAIKKTRQDSISGPVSRLLIMIKDPQNPAKRIVAMKVLNDKYITSEKNRDLITSNKKKEIATVLIEISLKDKDNKLRLSAVDVLGNIGSEEQIPVLEKISKRDPYQDKDSGQNPVRDMALKAIEKIKNRKKKKNVM